jgi:hypothetical protein
MFFATHCGVGFETTISLRITIILRSWSERMGNDPTISLRVAITLPRVIGVMTSDHGKR